MFRHILIATDGSELAAKGVDTGLGLAHQLKAKVTIVTASEPWLAAVGDAAPAFSFPVAEYDKAAAENAQRVLAAAAAAAKQRAWPARPSMRTVFRPRRSLRRQT